MNSVKGIAIVLIAAGALSLAYGGFSYTKETHEGHIGSLDLTVKDRQHVNIPVWAGIGAIVIGAGFLLVPTSKS
jgi:TRAP-type C4-dicarboxylate transport system permease small subunit